MFINNIYRLKDWIATRYEKKERIVFDLFNAALMAALIWSITVDRYMSFEVSNYLFFTFKDFLLIVCTGLIGEIWGMAAILAAVLFRVIISREFAYTASMYLILVIIVHHFCARRFIESKRKCIALSIILSFLMGNGWAFLVTLGNADLSEEINLVHVLVYFSGVFPEVLLAVFLLHFLYKRSGNRFRSIWWGERLCFDDEGKILKDTVRSSRLSRKFTVMITTSTLVIIFTAILTTNYLVPTLGEDLGNGMISVENAGEKDGKMESPQNMFNKRIGDTDGSQQRMKINNRTIAFDIKLMLVLMTIGLSMGLILDNIVQTFLILPIVRMSLALHHFREKDDENMQTGVNEIREIEVKSGDELELLYQDIRTGIDSLVDHIQLVREEEQLKNELKIEKAANEAKSSFLSNMSHEIRTPINAILGMDEMILREADEPQLTEYALNIQTSGKTLLSLVNDILDFSKIEAGKMELVEAEYELSTLINDLVTMIGVKAEQKKLDFVVNIDETIPNKLFGDDVRIKQCALNILTNAFKYTEKGSVTLRVTSRAAEEDDHIFVGFCVKDTGIGIKEEDIQKLFSPFERIEESRNRTIEGTGLGMNIVKHLLSLMGTQLTVKSVYGEGSDFSFEVKQRIVEREPIGEFTAAYKNSVEKREKYKALFRAPNAKILVVDDTVMNLTVIKGLLKETKINVETAESGFEALDRINENSYDCVFLDHRMPEMDGIETLAEIRTRYGDDKRNCPFIALTANVLSGAREEYLSAGFDDYLPKPVDAGELEKLLLKYLPDEKVYKEGSKEYKEIGDLEKGTRDEESDNAVSELMSALNAIEGIDPEAAFSNAGSTDLLIDLIHQFRGSIEEKADLIEKYYESSDWKNYTILVHALKSSSRLIGAVELSDLAREMEDAGNKEDEQKIRQYTGQLLDKYRGYLEKLDRFVKSDDKESDAEKTEIPEDELKDILQALHEFITVFDYDSAEDALHELSQYKLPIEISEKLEKFKKALDKVDRGEMTEILSEL